MRTFILLYSLVLEDENVSLIIPNFLKEVNLQQKDQDGVGDLGTDLR